MAWFDDSENSVGALSVRLTGDAANVQGVRIVTNEFFCLTFIRIKTNPQLTQGYRLSAKWHHSVHSNVRLWCQCCVRVHLENGASYPTNSSTRNFLGTF